MKPVLIFIIATFAISHSYAQKSLHQFIEKYAEVENFNNISLQGSLLNLVFNNSKNKKESVTSLNLKQLTAFWTEDYNPISKKEVRQLLNSLRKDNYEDLIFVKDGSANVNFLIQENAKTITGVILLVDDIDDFYLIQLSGKMNYDNLRDLDLDIEGIEHFKKLPKNRTRKRA
jgi:hypothetical protein